MSSAAAAGGCGSTVAMWRALSGRTALLRSLIGVAWHHEW